PIASPSAARRASIAGDADGPLSGRLNPNCILVLRGLHLHRLSPILLASSIRGTFRCRRIRRGSQTDPARASGENDGEARDLLQRGRQSRGRSVPAGGHQARRAARRHRAVSRLYRVRSIYLPDNARVLAEAGYVVLTFDYKGWGDSDGAKTRLAPYSRVA